MPAADSCLASLTKIRALLKPDAGFKRLSTCKQQMSNVKPEIADKIQVMVTKKDQSGIV